MYIYVDDIFFLQFLLFSSQWCVTKVAHCMLMFQYSKLLCMFDETVQEILVWSRTMFLPGVRSFGSEFGERTGTNPCSAGSEKEHGRTLVRSLDSELGEGTGPNPGSAGLEFGEPAEFGTCQTRVIPGPFSELRTTQPGLTPSKSDFQTETPNKNTILDHLER